MMEKDSGKLHTYFATNCAFLYSDIASNFAFIDDTFIFLSTILT